MSSPTPESPPNIVGGAVFLSYASQDADAVRRVGEALRAAGIEVWFDQDELVGGDAWDAKIRKQIKDCALFVPIISATTQARLEGYFRLEWKLAAQRTHTMAETKPFLLPVVIDATRDAEAHVPEEFRAVQWTRLPGGEAGAAFVTRVRSLLGLDLPVARTFQSVGSDNTGEKARATPKVGRRVPAAAWVVAVLVLAGVGAFVWRQSKPEPAAATNAGAGTRPPTVEKHSAPAIADKSIAVLPFENLSDDRDANTAFTEGVHADILTQLVQLRELRVISRASVLAYRDKRGNLRDLARQLGVAYILDGSVRRAAGKVRVTGQLIRAATDEHIWAQDYDRDLTATNVFEIQSDLARKIAASLRAALSPQEQKLLATRPTENTEAYELYLKTRGDDLSNDLSFFFRPILERHEALLRAAVALDPKFAAAWAELSVRHAYLYYLNYDHTDARRALAKSAIDSALALAPDAPQVIRALATYHVSAWRDYASATTQLEKITRIQPNDPETASALGNVQMLQGKWADALASLRKATQLDPANLVYSTALVRFLYGGRRWDETEAEGRRILALHPRECELGYWTAVIPFLRTGSTATTEAFFAALTPEQSALPVMIGVRKFWLLIRGDYDSAIRLAQIHPIDPASVQDQWAILIGTAFAHAAKGDLAAAQKIVSEIAPTYRRRVVEEPGNTDVIWTLGLIEGLLGNKTEALRLARQAVDLVPATLDAVSYPASLNRLVIIYAWAGEKDRAIEEVTKLLRLPFATASVEMMKRDPFWFPLRGDPRFEALLNDPKNNAPLF